MSSNKVYSKEITYPDGFTVAGSVKDIKCYWETANVVFGKTKVNLTSEGMRHLGAVIGNHPYKNRYVNEQSIQFNSIQSLFILGILT